MEPKFTLKTNKENKITENTQKIKEQIFINIPYVGRPTETLGKRIISSLLTYI